MSLLFIGSAYGNEPTDKTWTGTLVINWGGGGDTLPQVALLNSKKITDQTLSEATPLIGEAFKWNDEPVPGVWVFYLSDEMKKDYFAVALLTPIKLAGASSTTFRTEEAVMISKIEKVPRVKGRRMTDLNAGGVVGNLYEVSLEKMKCFGLPKDCETLELQVAAASEKSK